MQAVIIAVGDELISGATVDTNSAYLSRRLAEVGIATRRHVTVGDDAGRIAAAVVAAAAEAKLVLITGGLGPTLDDLCREGLAEALGVELVEDARQVERIAAFFSGRGLEMKPSNRRQGLVPAGAEAIDNDCGTAPGIAARLGETQVFVLPGPPHEAKEMFESHIAPRIGGERALARRTIHTFGAGESDVGELLADLMARGRDPAVGTTASAGVITVRISASGATADEAEAAADRVADEVRRRLGELVFGAGSDTMARVVGQALRSAGQTLALAESCTGGMIGQMVTATAGASDYFLGAVVSYANSAKSGLLGVPPELIESRGAVSEPVVAAMAEAAREKFGADWTLAVTGIAGPDGGTADKPVGLVFIALTDASGTDVHRRVFGGNRGIVRRRAAIAALNYLRVALAPAGD